MIDKLSLINSQFNQIKYNNKLNGLRKNKGRALISWNLTQISEYTHYSNFFLLDCPELYVFGFYSDIHGPCLPL